MNSKVQAPSSGVCIAYAGFFVCLFSVYHFVANREFSSILTMAVMFECFALALLGLQQWSRDSSAGISARSLSLEAFSFACRLSSTVWLNGYLPVDASGDHIFQTVDFISLLMVLGLLYRVLVLHRKTYEADEDAFPALPLALGALVLAAIFRADMNSRPFFDTLWVAGLFVGSVSVLPQLYLIISTGGVIQACTSHYIAMTALSRILSGTFMWYARQDVTCVPYIKGFNHAVWAIMAAHLVHLLLLGDFAFYYVKAVATQGLQCEIQIPCASDLV